MGERFNLNFTLFSLLPHFDSKTLFVIGNGFDLAHHLQTTYHDFEKRIRTNVELCQMLRQFVDVDCWWKDLEESLARIQYTDVINPLDILAEFYSEGKYDITDQKAFDQDIEELIKPLKLLTSDLTQCFKNWIERLSTKISRQVFSYLLPRDSLYLNFNYTDVLECEYGIPNQNVCHIHGERRRLEEDIIIGHGLEECKSYNENLFKNMNEDEQYLVWKVIEAAFEKLDNHVIKIDKNCGEIIRNHISFFNSIKRVNRVVIIGHSLGRVDYPYFVQIIKTLSSVKKTKWYISFYNNSDKRSIKEFINYFKLDNKNVECFPLNKDEEEKIKKSLEKKKKKGPSESQD